MILKKNKLMRVLISSYHMNLVLSRYSKVLKKNKIKIDKIIRNPSVKENELLGIIHKYDGVICSDDEFTEKVLKNAKKLKVISKWGTGIDSIDSNFAKKKGIKIFNSPGAFTKGVAQYALGVILNLTRKISENNQSVKNGKWEKFQGINIENKKVGIIGLGKIGSQVAKIGQAFGMQVVVWSENLDLPFANKLNVLPMSKEELLKQSDIISLHVVLGDRYKNLISKKEFDIMKKTCFLINTSRGPIINEKDLVEALEEDIIAGVGLDVYDVEPLPQDHKLRFLPNALLLPHLGYVTEENYSKFYLQMIENLESCLSGKPKRVLS